MGLTRDRTKAFPGAGAVYSQNTETDKTKRKAGKQANKKKTSTEASKQTSKQASK